MLYCRPQKFLPTMQKKISKIFRDKQDKSKKGKDLKQQQQQQQQQQVQGENMQAKLKRQQLLRQQQQIQVRIDTGGGKSVSKKSCRCLTTDP